jgi:hypothetical protein
MNYGLLLETRGGRAYGQVFCTNIFGQCCVREKTSWNGWQGCQHYLAKRTWSSILASSDHCLVLTLDALVANLYRYIQHNSDQS